MSDRYGEQAPKFHSRTKQCRTHSDQSGCSDLGPPAGVEAAVRQYIKQHRSRAGHELEYFSRVLRSDEDVVDRAALAQLPSGKRHPHQYRIPRAALEESQRRLLENLAVLRRATSFGELFDLVDAIIRPIPGIGELTVYDTALRIGARLGLEPTQVYIHAGTREGIRALGLDPRRQTVEMDELPAPMRRLSAREAEDLLCIYKGWLG